MYLDAAIGRSGNWHESALDAARCAGSMVPLKASKLTRSILATKGHDSSIMNLQRNIVYRGHFAGGSRGVQSTLSSDGAALL